MGLGVALNHGTVSSVQEIKAGDDGGRDGKARIRASIQMKLLSWHELAIFL